MEVMGRVPMCGGSKWMSFVLSVDVAELKYLDFGSAVDAENVHFAQCDRNEASLEFVASISHRKADRVDVEPRLQRHRQNGMGHRYRVIALKPQRHQSSAKASTQRQITL